MVAARIRARFSAAFGESGVVFEEQRPEAGATPPVDTTQDLENARTSPVPNMILAGESLDRSPSKEGRQDTVKTIFRGVTRARTPTCGGARNREGVRNLVFMVPDTYHDRAIEQIANTKIQPLFQPGNLTGR